MFTKLILFFNKLSSTGKKVQNLKLLEGEDALVDYFNTRPDSSGSLLTERDAKADSAIFYSSQGISEQLTELITWTVSRRTSNIRKFIFASFFALSLAAISQTANSSDTFVYGIVINNETALGLRLFLTSILSVFAVLYVISFIRDSFEYHALFYDLRETAEKLESIVKKWRQDMVKRNVRVGMVKLLIHNYARFNQGPENLIKKLNDIEVYRGHFKNPNKLNRILDIFDFIWPIALSGVTVYLVFKMTNVC